MSGLYPWQQTLAQTLTQRIVQGGLHHGLILAGKADVGKGDFARFLSQFLLCQNPNQPQLSSCGTCQSCQLFKAESHPDLIWLTSDKQIGVDAVREACNQLGAKSHLRGAKVLVIVAADTMTVAAANALLKTLEEPTERTYLLLLTEQLGKLLPTVKSRCEQHGVSVGQPSETQHWLQSLEGKPEHIDPELLRLYWQRPLFLQALLEDPEQFSATQLHQQLQDFLQFKLDKLSLAQLWQEHADIVLDWLQHGLHKQLAATEDATQQDKLWLLQQQLVQSRQALQQTGVNKTLVFAELLDVTALSQLGKQP